MVDREDVIMHPTNVNAFGHPNYANTHWQEGYQAIDSANSALHKYPSASNPGGENNKYNFTPTYPDPAAGVNAKRYPTNNYRMSVSFPNKNFVRFIQNSATTYNSVLGAVTLYFPSATVAPISLKMIGVFTGFTTCDSLAFSAKSTTAFYLVVKATALVDVA